MIPRIYPRCAPKVGWCKGGRSDRTRRAKSIAVIIQIVIPKVSGYIADIHFIPLGILHGPVPAAPEAATSTTVTS